jgi:anti-sigma regulatory factor (Ser/Thr protein kinase)
MAARYPRRQASRIAGALKKSFLSGLTLVEGRPRSGKTDFLLQLFDGLREPPGPMPAFVSLRGRNLDAEGAERIVAQLLAFAEGRLGTPHAPFSREAVVERPDAARWQPLASSACGQFFSASHFLNALATFAEQAGPVCLLLDDCAPECLELAATLHSAALAVVAAGPAPASFCGRVLRLEPFSTREALLLAELLARSLDLAFDNAAAEPVVACLGGDAFAVVAVVETAAQAGSRLESEADFIQTYTHELSEGTLGDYFERHAPGAPGSPAWRFALELLARFGAGEASSTPGEIEEEWLGRWRRRAPVEQVLGQMRESGWLRPTGGGWTACDWPAARHWALLRLLPQPGALARLTARLVSEVREAETKIVAAQRTRRIARALRSIGPAQRARLEGAGAPCWPAVEVCQVASERVDGAELFLCFGLASDRQSAAPGGTCASPPASPVLLAIALVPDDTAPTPALLSQLDTRVAAAAAPAGNEPALRVEKWMVWRAAGAGRGLELSAQAAGWTPLDPDLFRGLVEGRGGREQPESEGGAIVLKLPAQPEMELAAARLLEVVAERQGWNEELTGQARMALVEACLNAIAHARPGQHSEAAGIEVRLEGSSDELVMSVSNPGAPFDPGDTGPAGAALHRGHGLKIIRSFVDEVRFLAGLDGTSIQMRKRMRAFKDQKDATSTERN